MERVYIGLGSNLGERQEHLHLAEHALGKLPRTKLVGFSPIYETQPVGPGPQPAYLNAVALVETSLSPRELLGELLTIEKKAGRTAPHPHWGPRTLDLDILMFGTRVLSDDKLLVPHPLMHDRWFVLKPLADLDAGAVHPVLQMTIGELLAELERAGDPATMGQGKLFAETTPTWLRRE
ncbi:MAG: 2-amino-4-hydroxy-6-hydroxymethyldihydropteridine diphosphokinase [Phycisphaeraceae bacterium]|nr:2-amino-4-hydroxy-6-hydroxymethyldihydropteridine diphosphokinase [Phycisphaeraceae bacterium]